MSSDAPPVSTLKIPLILKKLSLQNPIVRSILKRFRIYRDMLGPTLNHAQYFSDAILKTADNDLIAYGELMKVLQKEDTEDAAKPTIDLSLGAPRCDVISADDIVEAKQSMPQGYPPTFGIMELRREIAKQLQRDRGLRYEAADEVLITHGATQGISLALSSFVSPGEKVILFDPSYWVYPRSVQLRNARVVWVETRFTDKELVVNMGQLDRAMRDAKMLFVNSPGNPHGHAVHPDCLKEIAALAAKHDVLLFSDEVYDKFLYEGDYVSLARYPGARNRTIVANSFSKSYGMCAYRIGYVAAPAGLMSPMSLALAIQQPWVPYLSQLLALKVLRRHDAGAIKLRETCKENRRWLGPKLREIGFDCPMPQGAFYFWLPVKQFSMTGTQFAQQLWDEERVLLSPGNTFGPSGHYYVRLSYATDMDSLQDVFDRLAAFVRRIAIKNDR